ncbi:MAG TPA: hypothetical protein VH008_31440 [Pseudonocardia sp.]|jgi:hypothetical protein|nr:hypothetical protein [Pseudonocardia sp.]
MEEGWRELGSRARAQPAPAHVVFDSLLGPHRPGARPWLELLDDEIDPEVLAQDPPRLLVWSSLWPRHPRNRIRFDLTPDATGGGCLLRWTLLTPDPHEPDDSHLGHLRKRLNVLVNERLRRSYGQ